MVLYLAGPSVARAAGGTDRGPASVSFGPRVRDGAFSVRAQLDLSLMAIDSSSDCAYNHFFLNRGGKTNKRLHFHLHLELKKEKEEEEVVSLCA